MATLGISLKAIFGLPPQLLLIALELVEARLPPRKKSFTPY